MQAALLLAARLTGDLAAGTRALHMVSTFLVWEGP